MDTIAEIGEYCISLRDKDESPYQCSFATSKEWSRQSNTFDKSVKRAPNFLPESITSIRTKTQCCVLYPFRNPHWLGNIEYFQNVDKVDYKLVFHTLRVNIAVNIAVRPLFSLMILVGISSCWCSLMLRLLIIF